MYNSQTVTERIKKVVKEKKVSMTQLNEICELSENTISQSAKSTYGMKAKNLYMIADYLGVSVDYLLGRTDEPKTINGNSIRTGDITGDNNANINATKKDSNKEITELAELINGLSLIERAKVVLFIDELKTKNK